MNRHTPRKPPSEQPLLPFKASEPLSAGDSVKPAPPPAAPQQVSVTQQFEALVSSAKMIIAARIRECVDILLTEIPEHAHVDRHAGSMRHELVRLFGLSSGGALQIPSDDKLRYFNKAVVREKIGDKQESEHWGNAVSYMAELRKLCPLLRHLQTGSCEGFVADIVPPMRKADRIKPEDISRGAIRKFAERLYRNNKEIKNLIEDLFRFAGVDFNLKDKSLVSKFKAAMQSKRQVMSEDALAAAKPKREELLFPDMYRDPLAAFRR